MKMKKPHSQKSRRLNYAKGEIGNLWLIWKIWKHIEVKRTMMARRKQFKTLLPSSTRKCRIKRIKSMRGPNQVILIVPQMTQAFPAAWARANRMRIKMIVEAKLPKKRSNKRKRLNVLSRNLKRARSSGRKLREWQRVKTWKVVWYIQKISSKVLGIYLWRLCFCLLA